MAKYHITSHHDPSQCSRVLDELNAQIPRLLEQAWFGCDHGDHTAYAIVDAANETEARNMLPGILRSSAQVSEVARKTTEEMKQMHRRAA